MDLIHQALTWPLHSEGWSVAWPIAGTGCGMLTIGALADSKFGIAAGLVLLGLLFPYVLMVSLPLLLPTGIFVGARNVVRYLRSEERALERRLEQLKEEEKLIELRQKVQAQEEQLWKKLEV